MSRSVKAGTAVRLLCLPLALSSLGSCGDDPKAKSVAQKPNEAEEMFQVVEATKNNPSLQPGSNVAGAPIHVNFHLEPRAKGHDDQHARHNMMNH